MGRRGTGCGEAKVHRERMEHDDTVGTAGDKEDRRLQDAVDMDSSVEEDNSEECVSALRPHTRRDEAQDRLGERTGR